MFDEIMLTVDRMRLLVRLLDTGEGRTDEDVSTVLYWMWEQFGELVELLDAYRKSNRPKN